jgi:hypothetical protein
MKQIKGYHVFYQTKEVGEYHQIDLLVQVTSILFWKHKWGSIGLYCNQEYLDYLKQYNLDVLYDDINVDFLEQTPYKQYYSKYWSLCKIEAAKHISQTHKQFAIIDTDLWIKDQLGIKYSDYDFVGHHDEKYDLNWEQNVYIDPTNFLPLEEANKLDFSTAPINCAFMYFNSKELIDTWHEWVYKIVELNKDHPKLSLHKDTIFIEQRLLPAILPAYNFKWRNISPHTYLTHQSHLQDGSEWEPSFGFNEESERYFDNLRHIWGMKTTYGYEPYREMILNVVYFDLFETFDINFLIKYLSKLIDECNQIHPNSHLNDAI